MKTYGPESIRRNFSSATQTVNIISLSVSWETDWYNMNTGEYRRTQENTGEYRRIQENTGSVEEMSWLLICSRRFDVTAMRQLVNTILWVSSPTVTWVTGNSKCLNLNSSWRERWDTAKSWWGVNTQRRTSSQLWQIVGQELELTLEEWAWACLFIRLIRDVWPGMVSSKLRE